jgi:hypothetical protein
MARDSEARPPGVYSAMRWRSLGIGQGARMRLVSVLESVLSDIRHSTENHNSSPPGPRSDTSLIPHVSPDL